MVTKREYAGELLKTKRVLTARELVEAGVARTIIRRMLDAGQVEEVVRGCYKSTDWPSSGSMSEIRLADLAAVFPDAVVCLESAAGFHREFDLTDSYDHTPTFAIPNTSRLSVDGIRFVRWRDPRLLTVGVEVYQVDGQAVKITTPARTVADYFRPENRMDEAGDDVASLALAAFTSAGGDLSEVQDIADELGWGDVVEPAIDAMAAARRRGF